MYIYINTTSVDLSMCEMILFRHSHSYNRFVSLSSRLPSVHSSFTSCRVAGEGHSAPQMSTQDIGSEMSPGGILAESEGERPKGKVGSPRSLGRSLLTCFLSPLFGHVFIVSARVKCRRASNSKHPVGTECGDSHFSVPPFGSHFVMQNERRKITTRNQIEKTMQRQKM